MVSDFNKKGNREFSGNKFLFQAVGILFFVIILVLIIADFKMYNKKKELSFQIISYQKRINDIEKNSQTLKEEIASSNNPEYLEKIAYEQGMIKNGEREVIFVTPQTKLKPVVKSENFWESSTAWISKSWNWIKSKF